MTILFFIKFKSFVDFLLLKALRLTIPSGKSKSSNLLFINTGQIGDLVISSTLLENDKLFKQYNNVYFLIDEKYKELFADYSGIVKLLLVNLNSYKYNYFYRIRFNKKINKYKIKTVYNITSVRPTWNDALALGIGSKEKYCYSNNWKTHTKVFEKCTDKLYTKVLAPYLYNEYDRADYLIQLFNNNIILKQKSFITPQLCSINYDIVISPFSSAKIKDWNIDNFKELTNRIPKNLSILLIGSFEQKNRLHYLKGNNTNVKISAGKVKLNELSILLYSTTLYIGLDSGISHIALKYTKKNIILVGGGTYGMYFPTSKNDDTIFLTKKLPCFNCEWKCKYNSNLCLSEISVSKVVKVVNNLLKR